MVAILKKNTGYTLVEILITLSILSILSGVAYVSYQGYNLNVNKKDLKTHAELFARAVQKCISVNGKWSVTGLSQAGVPDSPIKPCEATTPAELKSMLGFDCPAGATCETYTHGNTGGDDSFKYYCLSIKKTVSGKKLQVLSRISYKTSNYQIWCSGDDLSAYLELNNGTCKESKGMGNNVKIDRDKGFKKDAECWKKNE